MVIADDRRERDDRVVSSGARPSPHAASEATNKLVLPILRRRECAIPPSWFVIQAEGKIAA